MNKRWFVPTLACLWLAACTGEPGPTPEPEGAPPVEPEVSPVEASAEEPAAAAAVPEEEPILLGDALPTDRGELFAGSGVCATCHTRLVDEAGNDVSNDALWRASTMANAARDPYWQATVRAEGLTNPHLRTVIEDKCAHCHTPMAYATVAAVDEDAPLLDNGFLNPEHELHALAIDGVSCTLCHQIEETNFGTPESFSGEYVIDADAPAGERVSYGPFSVDEAQALIMQATSGYAPVQSEHIQQSEHCATCHTLYTPFVDTAGEVAGIFPEQTPYLEWLNSDYADATSCQACHMPQAEGGVVLSITGGDPRSPFMQHAFAGGNVFLLDVFRAFGEELGATASGEHFDAAIVRGQDLLQNRTAVLSIEEAVMSESTLGVKVVVNSQVGHKFPTGFPSRRVWLHVTVQDAAGEVAFESGGYGPDGSIVGNDNDADATAYEPHYLTVTSPGEVQIYEAIVADTEGNVTTMLLHAAFYAKDNRLLPTGFDVEGASEDIALLGQAVEDGDFVAGGDTVLYEVDLGEAQGPYTVTAELLYQAIGYRWAQNLGQHEAVEIDNFLSYYDAVPNLPVVVAIDMVEVAP